MFLQSKDRAKELFHELIYDGLNVEVIHADRTQAQRDNIIKSFRAGRVSGEISFNVYQGCGYSILSLAEDPILYIQFGYIKLNMLGVGCIFHAEESYT